MSVSASSAAGVGDADGPAGFLLSVVCELCFRDFVPADPSLAVPFCVSSCGHIFCDEHRRHADQCPECSRQDITIEPLTAHPPAPIAHFFDSLPRTVQNAQQAASFQLAHLHKIIRFFKDKVIKQRDVLNEVRSRLEASTKTAERVASLERENYRLVSELERLTSGSVPPPAPPTSVSHDTSLAAEQRKRKRDGFGVLRGSPVRPRSPSSSGSRLGSSAPGRYPFTHNGGQTSQAPDHAVNGHQNRVGVDTSRGGVSGLQQFAYQSPLNRSRASTPRPGATPPVHGYPPSSSSRRPALPLVDRARQSYATPQSARLQSLQPYNALPPRASTSQSMRGSSVQPMPVPHPQRPSSSRMIFTNDPGDPRSFPRQGFDPLHPYRPPPPQEAYLSNTQLDPGFGQQANSSSINYPTRTPFLPSTPRSAIVTSHDQGAHVGRHVADRGPLHTGPAPYQRPIFHQAGRG